MLPPPPGAGSAGRAVTLHLSADTQTLDAPLVFDASTKASEVWLIGDGATLQFGQRRRLVPQAIEPLLNVSVGAPRIYVRGLVLRGQVVISGGELFLDNCTFAGSNADDGGALLLLSGSVHASDVSFVGCSARRGGAALVALFDEELVNVSGSDLLRVP